MYDNNINNNEQIKTFNLNENHKNEGLNLKKYNISPNKDILQIRNKYFSNINIKKNSSIPFIKMNNLISCITKRRNMSNYNNYEKYKNNQIKTKLTDINLEENNLQLIKKKD